MGRSSRAGLRPLGVKSTNSNVTNKISKRTKTDRKLSNKISAAESAQISAIQHGENCKENIVPHEIPTDNEDRAAEISVQHQPSIQQPLTDENLKQLQNEMIELENVLFPCDHFLCAYENRRQLNSLRLWLLFELEMSPDNGVTNLRNSCYHDHVYEAVCPPWKVQSCLQQQQLIPAEDVETFPIQQLIIPEIEWVKSTNIGEITVHIGDLVEKDKFQKKIPSTRLSSQNRLGIFNSNPVNTTAIVKHKHRPEILGTGDDGEEDEVSYKRWKQPKISTLERKLALMGGISPPKLTKNR